MLRKSVATSGFTSQSFIHRKCAIYCVTFLLWLFVLILDTELHFCFETVSSPQKLPTKVAKSDHSPFQPWKNLWATYFGSLLVTFVEGDYFWGYVDGTVPLTDFDKLRNGGLVLGLSKFLLLPQLPQKMTLVSKVVKSKSKNIISIC